MNNFLDVMSVWTPWHTIVVVGIAIMWLFEWARIVPHEGAERRAQSLRGNIFQNYRQSLRDGLDRFATWIGDKHDDGPRDFSAHSYLASAGWAMFYPFLFLAIGWGLLGSPGSIGHQQLFSDNVGREAKAMTLAALAIAIIGPVLVTRNHRTLFRTIAAVAIAIIGASAFAFTEAFTVAGPVAFVGAAITALAIAAAIVGTVRVSLAGACAAAGAASFAVATAATGAISFPTFALAVVAAVLASMIALYAASRTDAHRLGWVAVAWIAFVPLVVALSLSALDQNLSLVDLDQRLQDHEGRIIEPTRTAGSLILLLVLLPAINAPLDWLSLGISRFLIRRISAAQGWFWEMFDIPVVGRILEPLVILLNLILALIIAAAVVVATAFFVALFDRLHSAGGTGIYDVPSYIAAVRADPGNAQYYWIYAMMFWTLVPTLVHSTVFFGSLLMSSLSLFRVGDGLALMVERFPPAARFLPALLLTALRIAPVLYLGVELVSWTPYFLSKLGTSSNGVGNGLADLAHFFAGLASNFTQ